jgi:hypothetical protein
VFLEKEEERARESRRVKGVGVREMLAPFFIRVFKTDPIKYPYNL